MELKLKAQMAETDKAIKCLEIIDGKLLSKKRKIEERKIREEKLLIQID